MIICRTWLLTVSDRAFPVAASHVPLSRTIYHIASFLAVVFLAVLFPDFSVYEV